MAWVEEQSWFGLEDLYIEYINHENYIKELCKKNIWITRDNVEINIKDMTTTHIQNCIKRIIKYNWRLYYLPLLQIELSKRQSTI